MSVTPKDVGQFVEANHRRGYAYMHSLEPVVGIVDESGECFTWRADMTAVIGPPNEGVMRSYLDRCDARAAALSAVEEFAETLHRLPMRLADATPLHPYSVADALRDLLDGGAP